MTAASVNLEPRIQPGKPLALVGYNETYTYQRAHEIPAQWRRFAPLPGNIPGQIGSVAYGVCSNNDDNQSFDYLSAVEVTDGHAVDKGLTVLRLPARNYAVFLHDANVSTLRSTLDAIWQQWSKHAAARIERAPFFERYGESFDPVTGNGGVEIWIPLKA